MCVRERGKVCERDSVRRKRERCKVYFIIRNAHLEQEYERERERSQLTYAAQQI